MYFVSEVKQTEPTVFKTPLQQMVYEMFREKGVKYERIDTDPAIYSHYRPYAQIRTVIMVIPLKLRGIPWRHNKIPHRYDTRKYDHSGGRRRAHHQAS